MAERACQQKKPQSPTGVKPRTLKRQSSKTLVEQQALQQDSTHEVSKAARRDQHIKVLSNKCLLETFGDFDDQEKCHIIDPETGLNLTDRVKQDKTWAHDKAPRAPKFGKQSGVTSSGGCIKGPLMMQMHLLWILLMMQLNAARHYSLLLMSLVCKSRSGISSSPFYSRWLMGQTRQR